MANKQGSWKNFKYNEIAARQIFHNWSMNVKQEQTNDRCTFLLTFKKREILFAQSR